VSLKKLTANITKIRAENKVSPPKTIFTIKALYILPDFECIKFVLKISLTIIIYIQYLNPKPNPNPNPKP